MNRLATVLATAALALPAALPACVDATDPYEGEEVKGEGGKADSSALAVFVDATFTGTLRTTSSWNDAQTVEDQLLYTVGLLNGYGAVARIDRAEVTDVSRRTVTGGLELTYQVTLPIAWPKRTPVPATLEMPLPRDLSRAGQEAFAERYGHDCVDAGAHDVDAGSMFYYYRPRASRCVLADADVHRAQVALSPSPINTTGKFPEYDKVWEDGVLEVVAIFGKYEDGATSGDAGITGYNTFVKSVKTELAGTTLVTVLATLPSSPGVGSTPDVKRASATRADGKRVHVAMERTDNVTTRLSQPAFRERYERLSSRADLIIYNGHAGLGTNVRALAQAGDWVRGQYVVVFMNGCDTYAYIDDALNDAHRAVNPDDTTGTKYVDIVNNAMPSFFHSMAGASMSLMRGLLGYDAPKTYEQIFAGVDSSQVVLVTGEQDNTFVPGGGDAPAPAAWAGLEASGTIAKNAEERFTTPTLAAGTYRFDMTGTKDADLYVRVGAAPTTSTYDCRPYKSGSNESCEVTLPQPTTLHVMVRGYAASSTYELVGARR
ncbi:MAG: PPC domain-containing protein [Kofleriaceae bacterium]